LKRRRAWFEGQIDLDPEHLVFIDETWASTNMARRSLGVAGRAMSRGRFDGTTRSSRCCWNRRVA
jgi:hypothetical protein